MSETNLYNTEQEIEKVILIAIDDDDRLEENLAELAELTRTSGAEVVGEMVQKKDKPHASTYFGKGKLEELKDYISLVQATVIISDDELSTNQIRNMSRVLDIKVMDRTMLILDIFARRALSSEGKAQVELAQLKYSSSRLIGLGKILSRQGAGAGSKGPGIGTRGPGEKKLEIDRRNIRTRIQDLDNQINEIKSQRQVQREKRAKSGIPVISFVGYTNSGKSTLMNYLTNAGVLSEDMLFATLDTTTRKLKLKSGLEILFTDTVGFIQKLPHTLIKAFNATLEELKYADILVHVVDSNNDNYLHQMETVYETLNELDCGNKTVITILNKSDLVTKTIIENDDKANATIKASAKTGEGIEVFLEKLEFEINSLNKKIQVLIPFTDGKMIDYVHKYLQVVEENYTENGVMISVIGKEENLNKLLSYMVV